MKKLLLILSIIAVASSAFAGWFSMSDIIKWKLVRTTDAAYVGTNTTTAVSNALVTAIALKVDISDGVATNLTVPQLVYTAVDTGTNYIATITWDATNNVFVVTETTAP